MRSSLHDLHRDLYEHGAEASFFLEARLGTDTLETLLAEKHVVRLDATPAGALIILGPEGRKACGLGPNYRTPPYVAADQYLRRRCLGVLEAKGWRYQGKVPDDRNLFHLRDPQGRQAYLLARWRRIPARTVGRTFNRMRRRLILEGAVLMVHTDSPHYLLPLVERSGGLVRPLSFLNHDGAGRVEPAGKAMPVDVK